MIWTPLIPPPHPSTIPTLSPLALSVLALIRQEGQGGEGNNSSETSYRATTHDRPRNSLTTNFQWQTRRELSETNDNLFYFQSSADMNSHTHVTGHHSRSNGNSVSISHPKAIASSSYLPVDSERRTPFEFPHLKNTNSQQSEEYSRNMFSQVQPMHNLGEPFRKREQMQSYQCSPFEPFVEIRENNRSTKQTYDNLSPDMEFDDMEVYSCTFNEEGGENIKILNSNHKSALGISQKIPVPTATTNALNFKEIKRRPLQKHGLKISTPLPQEKPASKRILPFNKMEPSDQTFAFANADIVPKFKRTLTKFKNESSVKSNPKIPLFHTKKYDKDIFQSKTEIKSHIRKEKFNQDRTASNHHKLLNNSETEKENFELDDVFDNAFENAMSKLEQEDEYNISAKGSKTPKVNGSLKNVSIEDFSTSSPQSKNSERLLVEIQENTQAVQTLVTQQESQNNLTTNNCNLDHHSELSENLFVKTQESDVHNYDSKKNMVNEIDDNNVSGELSLLPYQQSLVNFATNDSNLNQQSQLSENLFVKTQEIDNVYKNDWPQNRVNIIEENYQSEELSLPPYQKPFETNESPDFDVDDLFSLKDESLKESLAALKANNDNFKNVKTLKTYGNGQVSPSIPIGCTRSENINLTAGNLQKSDDVHLNGSSLHVDNDTKKQKTNGDFYGFPPVKSIYFQASDQIQNSNPGLQGMLKRNGNRINKENCYKIENLEIPAKVGDRGSTMSNDISGVSNDRRNVMKVDIEIEGGSAVAKSSSKKTSLKQSTLFDCRKFLPGMKSNEFNDLNPKQNAPPVEVPQEVDHFKKPSLPPARKGKTAKASPKVNQMKKPDKNYSLLKSDKQIPSKNNSSVNGFLQSNTPLQEIKQRCDPSKTVQTSLIKNEPVKRSLNTANQPKKSKKPCFVPPMVASHLTSEETSLKNYTITVIDDVSANELLQRLNSEELTKVLSTVTFKEGYTLLNKPEDQKKNSRCIPSGVMFMIVWGTTRHSYHWLPLGNKDLITSSNSVKPLVDALMSKSERNICFEAQAVYMLLIDVLKYTDISNWNAYDPLIGCWLLDPDNPPKNFEETSTKFDMDRNLLAVHPQANTKTQACDLLPVLDVAMNILQNRLVNASLWTVFSDMETKLIPILAVMESSSILVDVEKLHRTAEAMDRKLKKLQSNAHQIAERWFQLNSPQQLREILFDYLKLDEKFNLKIKKTEHGVKSTSETVLAQMKEYHPLPKIILEYRRLQKLKCTYVDGLIQHVKSDGTIGTSWEQVSAATGRITSKNPNLQAFPKCPINVLDGETIHLREMFKAREGCSFLAADFQQIEFRVFAHFTQDKSLLQAFREGGDIFQRLAERWLGGRGEEEREKTKRIVYSVMYGAGANKLSEYLHVEPLDAYKIIDNFVAIFPSLRSLPRTVITQCRAQGFVVTLSGRRRLFPHIRSTSSKLRSYSERQAMNFLIQGSAADICKAAMLDCDAEIKSRGLRAKLLLMIHDELVWEVDDRDLLETSKTVREAMEHRWSERLTLLVPIPVCVSTGKTLADMQAMDSGSSKN